MVFFLSIFTFVKMVWCLFNIWIVSFFYWGIVVKERWVKSGILCSKVGDSFFVFYYVVVIF